MEFAEQVKAAADIVGVIGEYVRLRKVGTRYTGLCPFHSEKTPSFSVNPQHQFFKCFGCGESGDVFSFIMKHDSVTFFEALKLLAERHGIPIPQRAGFADEDAKSRAALYRIHEIAEAEFCRHLDGDAGSEARQYLQKRGVPSDSIARFRLGFAPRSSSLVRLLQHEGFGPPELEGSGLLLKRDDGTWFERFRNRLMFPIHNESGKPIAFGGRALSAEDNPKYLNSPETKIYRKSSVLFNLHRAKEGIRQGDRVILVEGYMDVIGVDAAGLKGVIASCGTALTTQQVQALRRHSTNVVVNFDADNAGANASERSIQLLLAEGMRVRILTLAEGLDPDEFCKEHGPEAYANEVNRASGYFHWLADRARSRNDMRTAEGRYAAFQSLVPAIQTLTDKLERAAVVNDVAGILGIEGGLVLDSFRKMVAERKPQPKPERPVMRTTDRILFSLLLSETAMRDEFFAYLHALPSLKECSCGRIYEALLALYDSGQAPTYSALHGRLSAEDQDLLAAALLSEEAETATEADAMACLEALVVKERERERSALQLQIREAERRGDFQTAMQLMDSFQKLQARF